MATSTSPPFFYNHVPKNILLILLSFISLPSTTILVAISYAFTYFSPQVRPPPHHQHEPLRKKILVTGVSMTKGLAIARLLAQHTPHRIIGADIEPILFMSPGRYSRSISHFYRLDAPDGEDTDPYIDSLLSVIKREKVDLWISCSSVGCAVEDGQVMRLARKSRGDKFKAVQFSPDIVEKLHAKDRFIEYVKGLSLPVPESYRCTSANEVHRILSSTFESNQHGGREKKFIMKPIGVDDRARNSMMTLLPLETASATSSHISNLRISKENPFQLQQYIRGPEYCTHALVIQGVVKAFVTCPSSDLLMHYKALPPDNPLSQQMLDFTKKVAEDGGSSFTGHLSFDFLADGNEEGEKAKLYAIECNPRAHTAVCLFQDTPEMADAYLDVFPNRKRREGEIFPLKPTCSYYWVGHDFVALVVVPLLELLLGQGKWERVKEEGYEFWQHLLYWRDGTFVVWDPVPFWVLYQVYWPVQFLKCLLRGKVWSRINVSTTKIFEC